MSCILLQIERADLNGMRELGVFKDRRLQEYSIRPPKKFKPTEQALWCVGNLHRIVWNSGCLDYSQLSNILSRVVKGEYISKVTENEIFGKFLDKEVENLDDYSCPKAQNLVGEMKQMKRFRICWSYAIRRTTKFHCAEDRAKLLGNWAMQHSKL